MKRSLRDGERKWMSGGFGGSTTRASASKGRQFGEEPVQQREVYSSPQKGRRISLPSTKTPPMVACISILEPSLPPRYPGRESTAFRVQGKCFPTVEFQHRTEREDEKMQNSVALAMLMVDIVLRVERVSVVLRDWSLSNGSVSNATFVY